MASITLYIGNHNYSSWSLRPWILLRHLGIDFDEVLIPLDQPETRARILAVNPAGKLPLLRHGALDVWESMAICEYACELAGAGLPHDAAARAVARSLAAELHAGFMALRRAWPMNARARPPRAAHAGSRRRAHAHRNAVARLPPAPWERRPLAVRTVLARRRDVRTGCVAAAHLRRDACRRGR